MNLEEYFNDKFTNWGKINKIIDSPIYKQFQVKIDNFIEIRINKTSNLSINK